MCTKEVYEDEPRGGGGWIGADYITCTKKMRPLCVLRFDHWILDHNRVSHSKHLLNQRYDTIEVWKERNAKRRPKMLFEVFSTSEKKK